jgi:hypothetical protein
MLVSMGASMGAFSLLAMLSIPAVVDAQAGRLAGQTLDRIEPQDAVAQLPAPMLANRVEEFVGDRTLTRIVVGSVTPQAHRPQWLSDYPQPGEFAASPALIELLAVDPHGAGTRFRQTLVEVIGDDGLVSPDQLLAIVGVEDDAFASFGTGGPARGLGLAEPLHKGPDRRVIRVLAAAAAVFVVLPTMILIATSARLSARTRQRRLAALRLLGLTPARTAAVNAVEVILATGCGAMVGAVLWRIAIPATGSVGIGSLHWFPNDVAVSGQLVGVSLVTLVAIAVAISVIATRQAVSNPLHERSSAPPETPPRLRRVVLVLLGFALLGICSVWSNPTTAWFALFAAGNLTVGFGLYVALPFVAVACAPVMRRVSSSPAPTLAARRLAHEPGAVARTTAAVLALVLIAGFAQTLTLVLDWATTRNGASQAEGEAVMADVRNAPLDVQEIVTVPGVERALPIVRFDLPDGDFIDALIAACGDLVGIAITQPENCDDSTAQGIFMDAPIPGVETGESIEVEYRLQNGATGAPASARIAPDLVPTDALPPRDWLVRLSSTDANEALANAIISAAPAAEIVGPDAPDRGRQASTYQVLVTTATLVAIALVTTSTIAAVADRTLERKRTSNQLLALGVQPRMLRTAEALWISTPLLTGLAGAVAASTLAAIAYLNLGFDDFDYPTSQIVATSTTGLLAIILTTAASTAFTPTKLGDNIESDA